MMSSHAAPKRPDTPIKVLQQTAIAPFEIDDDQEKEETASLCPAAPSCSLDEEAKQEPFHDNPSLLLKDGKHSSSLKEEISFIELEACNPHQHGHLTSSFLFLILMTTSSTLSFILQLYCIHLILEMTIRMYFCFPVIFFQSIEKTFVLLVTRRIIRSTEYDTTQHHQQQQQRPPRI